MNSTTKIGRRAETFVSEQYRKDGYKIIAQNWRTKECELDLVAIRRQVLVFIEVKYRKNADFGGGEAAISADKIARLYKGARSWLAINAEHNVMQKRFDVAVVSGPIDQLSSHLYQNALTY